MAVGESSHQRMSAHARWDLPADPRRSHRQHSLCARNGFSLPPFVCVPPCWVLPACARFHVVQADLTASTPLHTRGGISSPALVYVITVISPYQYLSVKSAVIRLPPGDAPAVALVNTTDQHGQNLLSHLNIWLWTIFAENLDCTCFVSHIFSLPHLFMPGFTIFFIPGFATATQGPVQACCRPVFTPPVDHVCHSGSSQTAYYVVTAGWTPGIYTNTQAADTMTNGFSGYVHFKVATKDDAIRAWKNYCKPNHGVLCDKAPPHFLGIKYNEKIFASREDAIEHTDLLGLHSIHLFRSLDKEEVEEFVGLRF
ncbi:hypothetical protein B0H14DRAFT_3460677 [Mycena olivaceomarginata]|nr:hypothetical protein B0H14DRAFT_3460677 [Mycena olivaceomarginata]